MLDKKALELNTSLNTLIVVVIILVISAGYFMYTNKSIAREMYTNVFEKLQPKMENEFKTIEITMYDLPNASAQNMIIGLKRTEGDKTVAEVVTVETKPSQKMSKIAETSRIKETENTDLTMHIQLLVQQKYGEFYFDDKPVNVGDEFVLAFDNAFVNGTVTRILD